MEKVRIGVAGLGMGMAHVSQYRTNPHAEVIAVADINPDKESAAKDLNIDNFYTDVEEMLKSERLDVLSIALPNFLHKPMTLLGFKYDCHVYCEKPMAMNAEEAVEMADAAKVAGKRLMVGFSSRFSDQAAAMKYQVESGTIGDIYYAKTTWRRRSGFPGLGGDFGADGAASGTWFGQKELAGGGPLIDLGVHRLDLALWLMDFPEPEWIMASTYDHIAQKELIAKGIEFSVEDFASAMIKFKNGATLSLEASWAGNQKEAEFMETQLFGTEGGLRQNNLDEGYSYEAEVFTTENQCQYDKKLHAAKGLYGSSQKHFIDAIVNDKPHVGTPEEGIIVTKILDAIYKSAETGEPVKL